jgi:3D (Asp-Asp-Asp) domain-containing protein
MLLCRSAGWKVLVTVVAAVGFASLYEVTTLDSLNATREFVWGDWATHATPVKRLRFSVTGYCKGTTTASGLNVRTGIAASDPDLLPVGSIVQIDKLDTRHNGVYTIMDTGPAVQGRNLDIYMWSCDEALQLGRRDAAVTVVRLGWNPRASTPRLIDRLFRQREAQLP